MAAPGLQKNPVTNLNQRQEQFCEAYIANGYNATQAYLTAYGGTYETANGAGCRLLRNPDVLNYIRWLQKDALEQKQVTAERIALELANMAFAQKGDEDYPAGIKIKALDLLQKQFGLQQQKIKADVDSDQTIRVTID